MIRTIAPGTLSGGVAAIPSKSDAHRILIAAALCDGPTEVVLGGDLSADMHATIDCLTALGATFARHGDTMTVTPITALPTACTCTCDCGESGSTARFLLPVAAALAAEGGSVTFVGHGRLPERPMAPLCNALRENGAEIAGDFLPIRVGRGLRGGDFRVAGNISSQYITGLLLALPLLGGGRVTLTSPLESRGYVDMTMVTMARFGVAIAAGEQSFSLSEPRYRSPGRVTVEGDWSNAAVWLCAGALSCAPVTVRGLDPDSRQGDRAVAQLLQAMGARLDIRDGAVTVHPATQLRAVDCSVRDIPDLVPVLAVTAALAEGESRFRDAGRLRLKESDRLETVRALICALGGRAAIADDTLVVTGVPTFSGGDADSAGDHRIAMAAALASLRTRGAIVLHGAEAVAKSYPTFWADFASLRRGGADCAWGDLTLRPACAADAALLAGWWNDGAVMAHAGYPRGIDTTPARVAAQLAEDSDERGRRLILMRCDRPIGEANWRRTGETEAEIGIKICLPEEQNRGQGKIFLSLLISSLFARGFTRIKLDTDRQNLRAQHVYAQLGFTRIGVREACWRDQDGILRDAVDFALTPAQFCDYTTCSSSRKEEQR